MPLALSMPVLAGIFFALDKDDAGSVTAEFSAGISPVGDNAGAVTGPASAGSTADTAGGAHDNPAAVQTGTAFDPGPDKSNPKLESSINELMAARNEKGLAAATGFATSRGFDLKDGKVKVVIEAAPGAVDSATEAAAASGSVVETSYQDLIQADVPLEKLGELASAGSISYIREPRKPVAFETVSEGVADIGASAWQAAGDSGAGVKVAVVDLGFAGYQALASSGELPAGVTAVSFSGDITGGNDSHGSACAEIVHDVAPGAQLYLVNFNTDVELGNAIDYLIGQGVNVVSASWGFFGDYRGDGQGAIDDMVKHASDSGILWANASGNAAQSHWAGHFTDANSDTWNEFVSGDSYNRITAWVGESIDLFLTWDRWPTTDQDYDLYLYWSGDPTHAVACGCGEQSQAHPGAPSEEIHYTIPEGKGGTYFIAINKYSASGDANLQLFSHPGDVQYQVAAGSLAGQPTDSAYAMTVGAVAVGSTSLESFSSRGPTTDGRIKPDLSAPDRVSTVTFGATGFWGTSAAAPHAAGAAALIKGANPAYSSAQIQSQLESRATDLGTPGKDNLFGSGKLAMGAVPDHTPPLVTAVQPSGIINTNSTTVQANYMDTGSGINLAAVDITLDGALLSGCTVTLAQASCPVSGLVGGNHNIGGGVADNAGNFSPIAGSFTVDCAQPQVSLESARAYWASFSDYLQGDLSISAQACDVSGGDAFNVAMVGASSTDDVQLKTAMPLAVGGLTLAGPGNCAPVKFKYELPGGVAGFWSTIFITAQDICGETHSYPSPPQQVLTGLP